MPTQVPVPHREEPVGFAQGQYSQLKNTAFNGTFSLSRHALQRINIYEMRIRPKFQPLAASLFLAAWFTCIPARTDTHFYASAPRSSPLCACGCENSSDGNAHRCTPICNLDRCEGEGPGSSCKPSPKSFGSSERTPQSRPAYSRKSNRAQRARL
jgi:hypothetical protein